MKTFACLLATCSIVTVALADSHSPQTTSSTQRINNFMSGGINTGVNIATQPNGRLGLPMVSIPTFSFNSSSNQSGSTQFTAADLAELFTEFSTAVTDHHFDPSRFDDLQALINSLHISPQLASKLNAFFENLENGTCGHFHDVNSGSDDNDENADNDNDNDNDANDLDEGEGELQAVPEPNTAAMVITGAALLAGTFFRRRIR